MSRSASYWAYRMAAATARRLPEGTLDPLERALGRLAPRLMPERAAQVARNLRRVYGPGLRPKALRQAQADTFRSYAHYWSESFRLPETSPEELDEDFTVCGLAHLDDALAAGRGVILSMPHLGGWEWAAFWLTRVHGIEVSAVVEAVQPPELADWFLGLRRSLGVDVIQLGPKAGRESLRALRANRVLCLLSDRDLHGEGSPVDFFGERTTLPAGPATLALRTGAPLLPAAVYFEGRGHRAVVRPPLDTSRQGKLRDDIERITAAIAGELEELIRVAPEQWHLLQPNWPSDLA